jgi:hypothetical protein
MREDAKAVGATVFMERPCEFTWLRGDLFRIFDPNTGLERIVEARVLSETIANAARCYRDYRTSQSAEIIRFPKPKAERA